MIHTVDSENLLSLDVSIPVIDVRTPAEFAKGHIIAAHNIPLFNNEERVKVGTTYKQVGREQAILLGFDLTGPKWSGFIKQALEVSPEKTVAVHCWRGGMRSGAMAWALNLYGFDVYLLEGGYKMYRRWVHAGFKKLYNLFMLGGMTGTGKTRMLYELKNEGEKIIDLERIAQHQGSSFGSMGKLIQPEQEQFENELATALSRLDIQERIWIEDESITIGKRGIPLPLFRQMRVAPVIELKAETENRVLFLAEDYGKLDKTFLIESTERIQRRLGPEQTKYAVAAINEGRMEDFIRIVLVYYDKTYQMGLSKRQPGSIHKIELGDDNAAARIIELANNISTEAIH